MLLSRLLLHIIVYFKGKRKNNCKTISEVIRAGKERFGTQMSAEITHTKVYTHCVGESSGPEPDSTIEPIRSGPVVKVLITFGHVIERPFQII